MSHYDAMTAWRDDADLEVEDILRYMTSHRINPSLLEICADTTKTGRMQGGYGSVFKAKLHSLEISQLEENVRGFIEINENGDRCFVVPSEDGIWPRARHAVVVSADVAVKKLRLSEDMDRAQLKRRFVREIRIWSSLGHPNVIQFIGYHLSLDQDDAWLVSRWNHGANLQDLLENATLNEKFITTTLQGTAAGLAYLHGREPPIIHGDIKPSNVLLTHSGRAQLCDFGLSQICISDGPLSKTSSTFKGSVRCDVWAWGVLAYQMAIGCLPFGEESDAVVVARIIKDELPQALPPLHISFPLLGNMVARCWSKEPSCRPLIVDCFQELLLNSADGWSESAVYLSWKLHILLCLYFSLWGLGAWEVGLLTLQTCRPTEGSSARIPVMAIIPVAHWIFLHLPYRTLRNRWSMSWLSILAMGMVKGEVRPYRQMLGFMLVHAFPFFWLGFATWLLLRGLYCDL